MVVGGDATGTETKTCSSSTNTELDSSQVKGSECVCKFCHKSFFCETRVSLFSFPCFCFWFCFAFLSFCDLCVAFLSVCNLQFVYVFA